MVDIKKKPMLEADDAQLLAAKYYGLDCNARELTSERDQNYLLVCSDSLRYVLKIANPSEDLRVIHFENQVLDHVANIDSRIPIPKLWKSLSGLTMEKVSGTNGEQYFIRVITFLQGKPMASAKPYAPGLLHDLGSMLSRLDLAMIGLWDPVALRPFTWSLYQASSTVKALAGSLENGEQRTIVNHFLANFESFALPLLPGLPQSLIHNDANDYNILVSERDTGEFVLSGLLDFGDLIWGPTIYEPAVAAAYAILEAPDPIGNAGYIIAGYHEISPLTRGEIDIFFELITIRLCTSVVLAAHQRRLMPDNKYLSISEQAAWVALKKLVALDPAKVKAHFLAICEFEPARGH